MSETSQISPAKPRYKVFTYRTRFQWVGDRAGRLESDGKPELRVSSPPEFKGESGTWTPEDLFVAAVEGCTMTTFLAFAKKHDHPVVSYSSEAEGTLEMGREGYQFTQVVLRPKITVSEAGAATDVAKTLHEAHRNCIIANSIRASVRLEPTIRVAEKSP